MRKIECVSRETLDRLGAYKHLLEQWNRRIRLIGRMSRDDIACEVVDSLELGKFLPVRLENALDIGSGNGFPAIPLSIAFNIPYTLVESDKRKAAFLQEVARMTACPVIVATQRIEDFPPGSFSLVTARAFARLPVLIEHAYKRQTQGTVCLFPKARDCHDELDEAQRSWQFNASIHPLQRGAVVQISSIRPIR